jgi:hypothetical protein
MELLLGSHVREHGHRWRLAGIEVEPADLRIRRLIVSPDGELGPQAVTRPLSAIATVHRGTIELRPPSALPPLPAVQDVILLSRSTRFCSGEHENGRLLGVDADPNSRQVLSAFGRFHWWSRRATIASPRIDVSSPGEVRERRSGDTRAA